MQNGGKTMNHEGTKIIETERLLLRPFDRDDTNNVYHNWAKDNRVTRYLTWPTHESTNVTQKVLESWIEQYTNKSFYQWAIVYKNNNQAIGSISVVSIDETIEAMEIGYCIGYDYWNMGITTEAFKALISYLFDEVKCNRISARHDINNPSSGYVMKKCGLKPEGIQLQAGKNNIGICDIATYGIIRSHYLESKNT
jgi:[ribosomal protein S5]-alanine N-acetyltransferase